MRRRTRAGLTKTTLRKRTLATSVALATAVTLASCGDDSAGPEQGTDVEDVAEAEPGDPAEGGDLLGKTVTLTGEISETIDPAGFWLGGDGNLFEDGAPVISTAGAFTDMDIDDPESLMEDDTVLQVTGTVAEFVVVDFEEEYGVDLDDELYEDLDGEAVVIAEEVVPLAGKDVTIQGGVTELLSTVAFRLAGTGWTVVVLDADMAAIEPGDVVEVQGTVRQMNLVEIEEDYGLDLDDGLYGDYEGDLVLVADTVTEVAAE